MNILSPFKYFLFVFIYLFVACNSNSGNETRLRELEKENKELQKKTTEQESNKEDQLKPLPDLDKIDKYVFVLLSVSQRGELTSNGWTRVNYNYCSEIKNFEYVDEDVKYQFLDKIQEQYLNSADASVYKGKVNDRKIFVFDTYEAASKEREKYLITK